MKKKLTHIETELNKFGKVVVTKAKKNIVDRKINSGGQLRKSISHKVNKQGDLEFYMEDYGVLRDAGQLGKKRKILKGWNKSVFIPRGQGFKNKFPKVDAIKKWVRTKPVRFGNMSLNSMAFLIGRKIFNEGIQPGLFFSDPFEEEYKRFEKDVLTALDKDINELID